MANKLIAILALVIFVGCVIGAFFFGRSTTRTDIVHTDVERDTIVVRDTIREYYPSEVSSSLAHIGKQYLRVGMPLLVLRDTVTEVDSVLVEIPIIERTYESDEYRAVIEGFNPRLKSMEVYPRTVYVNTSEIVKERKRWGVSLGVQGGYGITPVGWQPYAGVGVSFGYNF